MKTYWWRAYRSLRADRGAKAPLRCGCDDLLRGHAVDLLARIADALEHFAGMLADLRHVEASAEALAVHLDRQHGHFRLLAIEQRHRREAARRVEMRIVEEVFRFRDRRERQPQFFALVHQRLLGHLRKKLADDRHDARPRFDA